MPRSQKPRRPHRPIAVLMDPLSRLQRAPASQTELLLARFRSALEAMARGSEPGPCEWRDMADVVNTLEALTVDMGVLDAAATAPVIQQATAAMVAAEARYRRTGRAGLDGPGLQALRDALDLYAQAAHGLTQHAMARARDIVQQRVDVALKNPASHTTAVGAQVERGVGRLEPERAVDDGPILLHTLPKGHDLRQRPLLDAQCRNLHSKEWRDIRSSWAIAGACFDQLGDGWTRSTEFRMTHNDKGKRTPEARSAVGGPLDPPVGRLPPEAKGLKQ